MKELQKKGKILKRAASLLHCEPEQLPAVIAKFKKEVSTMERKIKRLKK